MRYHVVLGLTVPAYKTVAFDSDTDASAVKLVKASLDQLPNFQDNHAPLEAQWDLADDPRAIILQRADGTVLLENFPGATRESVDASDWVVSALAADLRSAVSADIWYDAKQHGDAGAQEQIERAQAAMERAAHVIEQQSLALQRLLALVDVAACPLGVGENEFRRLGGWRDRALIAVAETRRVLGYPTGAGPAAQVRGKVADSNNCVTTPLPTPRPR